MDGEFVNGQVIANRIVPPFQAALAETDIRGIQEWSAGRLRPATPPQGEFNPLLADS